MIGIFVVRHFVPLSQLRTNNEVAGFKFATVGVLYAVLLAFAVIVVWEKFNEAEGDVALEAGAAVTLYRLADGMEPNTDTRFARAITAYLEAAVAEDWPAMARGEESPAPASRRWAGSTPCCFGSSRSISAAQIPLAEGAAASSTSDAGPPGQARRGIGHRAGRRLARSSWSAPS